nr:ABC transporter ATP-binding protein [uncultured bacterium]
MGPDPAPLEVHDLVKRYGDRTAVAGVSFRVERGSIFCLLGENGAGKTTTLEVAQGLRRPTAGLASLFGVDAQRSTPALRRRMGVLPQRFACFPGLTVRENLRYFADVYDARGDGSGLLERLGLAEHADQLVSTLSGGTARRVGVATALVHDPELVFLDEPTAGVDPASRRRLWDVLLALRDEGKAIVLTTHYMDEAERLADDILVLRKGRTVARGRPSAIRQAHGGGAVLRVAGLGDALPPLLAERAGVEREADGAVLVRLADPAEAPLLLAGLLKAGVALHEVSVREPTLDDAFLRLSEDDA